jgi:hypothetical protein
MKLGRDKLKSTTSEKDDIEDELGRDKLKADKSVADGERKCQKTSFCGRRKKSTVRVFLDRF